MAKISTYPIINPPLLSDIIIGSDVANSNVTKNFEIADILALANSSTVLTSFVPYTGATGNVNLGTYDIQASDGIFTNSVELESNVELILDGDTGSAGDVMLSQGAGQTPVWQSPNALFTGYVPYTGATDNVNIGTYNFRADYIQGNEIYSPIVGGDILEAYEEFKVYENAPISLDGDKGNSGDLMISQGPLTNPIWQTQTAFFANAVLTLPTYASNAAALAGGLVQGQLYKSAAGVVSIVL
jgi:hypothetical protein